MSFSLSIERIAAGFLFLAAGVGAPADTLAADAPLAPGFRRLEGRHLTLVTDLASSGEVDELPQAFDAAFPQWCEYFGLDARKHADWHVTGYLVGSKERFQQAGYWRANLPPFLNGYSTGKELWLYDQTSPYYRRHLLLHEGVHSLMYMLIGTAGPPWYMEGIAELLATHRWQDEKLTVNFFPRSADELPGWGRLRLVQEDVAAGKGLSVDEVLAYDSRAHLQLKPYAWSWALAAFLDGHPRYRERFRRAAQWVRTGDFPAQFRRAYAADWPQLAAEWQIFTANLNYGYDFARMAIDIRADEPPGSDGARCSVAADRGWQASGVRLEAGKKYRLTASGRYRIGERPAPWWCEPGGVTIRYNKGQPLGILLAAVHDEAAAVGDEDPSLIRPAVVGLEAVLAPTRSGMLYLRINEPAGELADNEGQAEVRVQLDEGGSEGKSPPPARPGKSRPARFRGEPKQ